MARYGLILGCLTLLLLEPGDGFGDDNSRVIASVNGQPVTAQVLQADLFLRRLPEQATAEERAVVIQRLIDRELIRQFLNRRKIVVEPELVDRQISLIKLMLETKAESYDEVLMKIGLDESSLRQFLELPIAWELHVATLITEKRVQQEYDRNGWKFDGTKVRASQIVRVLGKDASDPDWADARALLNEVRTKIVAEQLTFEDAAQEYSQSPSGKQGGLLGEFEYFGRVAEPIAAVAFTLKEGEISEPIRTPFGWHLIRTETRTAGELSQEDVRPQLVKLISLQMWDEQVAKERKVARIKLEEQG